MEILKSILILHIVWERSDYYLATHGDFKVNGAPFNHKMKGDLFLYEFKSILDI